MESNCLEFNIQPSIATLMTRLSIGTSNEELLALHK